jgi:hypothetical protein
MSEFKLGDLVEFIPENFDWPDWSFRLIGIGYVENIGEENMGNGSYNVYHIYCGKLVKQQMKNFVEIEIKNQVIVLSEKQMRIICRKINSK